MNPNEVNRFNELYQCHPRLLKLQGKARKQLTPIPGQFVESVNILAAVLPKGFRRVRDYGFLHSNAKKLLVVVQLILRVFLPVIKERPRPVFKCPCCQTPMIILGFRYPGLEAG